MKMCTITTGVLIVLATATWAAEDFTGTKEVRLIQGDIGSPRAKTVVVTDKAKIEKLLGAIKLEKKVPCACDHINHAVFVKGKGEITVSLCDHCFDVGKNTYVMPQAFYKLYTSLVQEAAAMPAEAATAQTQVVAKGLILDLNADKGVEVEDGDRVIKWTNQVTTFSARDFVKQDQGRKEPGSGRPTLKKSVATIGGHNTLVFRRQELVNHDEDAFDHLLTGRGYTWIAVISVYKQAVQLKDVHSFFGNLKNGGMYEGIWGNVTDDNQVWIGSRNGITFGRWDQNNPMVLAPRPLEEGRFDVVAGRMGSGTGEVQIELFINEPQAVASKPFPVNSAANSSKLAVGQERDATNHPGRESFDGELARFLVYERPLMNAELQQAVASLKKMYANK